MPGADRAAVDAFHAEAVAAGYADDGAPGTRGSEYAAFIRDPDGNTVGVVHRS